VHLYKMYEVERLDACCCCRALDHLLEAGMGWPHASSLVVT
jgi:hypothetical protein